MDNRFIKTYFAAEKNESMIFILAGFITLISGMYFLNTPNQPLFKGLSYPFIAISLIQLIVGITVYFRSDKDFKRVDNYVTHERLSIITNEIPRMEKVMANFKIYRYIEIFLAIIGLILMFVMTLKDFWKGFGDGLLIQASLMLFLDFMAEHRGENYLNKLKQIV